MASHPVFVNRSLVQKRFQTEPYLKILMGNSALQQSDGTRCGFVCNNRFVKARNCVNGSTYSFTCKNGYKKRPGVDKVVCNREMYTPEDPYEAIMCPKVFNQGIISRTCASMIGQQYDYECTGYGYKKNESIPTIECMALGTESRDTAFVNYHLQCLLEFSDVSSAAIVVGVVVGVSIIIVITLVIWRRKSLISKFSIKRMEEEVISGLDIQMSTSFMLNTTNISIIIPIQPIEKNQMRCHCPRNIIA